ncbi:hypothetical protein AAG570_000473, partial [Ranatra chinensis]
LNFCRLYIVTYNVATRNPDGDLLQILNLKPDQKSGFPDFYLIGLQEVKSQPQNFIMDALFDDPWTNAFRQTLMPFGYIKIKTVRLVGLVLTVFCLRKHVIHLRDMQSVCTRTGLMGLWGNKGGISLRLQIYGCSICFVNCHLTPHDHLLPERINDYNAILQNQKFQSREAITIMFHDYIFWFGDLNFRLGDIESLSAVEIERMIKRNQFESLLERDQLRKVMSSGDAFSELVEEELSFPPTYKYLFNSEEYDLKRRPGWTDRILYKVNTNAYENVTLEAKSTSYRSFHHCCTSDHKPVTGEFTVKVFSNYVERMVKFLPLQTWFINEVNYAVCIIGSDVTPTMWDWIGVYADNFTSLDDYYSYIYLPVNNEEVVTNSHEIQSAAKIIPSATRDRIELRFHEGMMRSPGKYRLIYFSQDSSSVLGMSSSFLAQHRDSGDVTSSYLEW